jgi:threonine aldolase
MAVDLTAARPRRSAAELLSDVAEKCGQLGVEVPDVYGDWAPTPGSWLRRFEREVAAELGKEDALFMPSGTMAQQIALLIHAGRRPAAQRAFICHYSSHVLLHEQRGYEALVRMQPLVVAADDAAEVQRPLAYADVAPLLGPPVDAGALQGAVLGEELAEGAAARAGAGELARPADARQPPAACLVVELPHREIGGKCTPWADLAAMSAACARAGVAYHMDGARLWEAAAGYGRTLRDLAGLFDSVYCSFYKGLGGLSGAMLLGDTDFIAEARVWQRRFGGNLFTLLPYAVSAWAGFRQYSGDFGARRDRMRAVVARLTAEFITPVVEGAAGGGAAAVYADPAAPAAARRPLLRFDPPVPEVSLVHVYLAADVAMASEARDLASAQTGVVCFSRIRQGQHGAAGQCLFEFNIGPGNTDIADEVWVRGWDALLRALRQLKVAARTEVAA